MLWKCGAYGILIEWTWAMGEEKELFIQQIQIECLLYPALF